MRLVSVAVVAPASSRGAEEYRNAAQAVAYVEEAAARGVDIVCFPEGYPGPCTGPMDSDGRLAAAPVAMLQAAARRHRMYITCGNLEETGVQPETYYLCQKVISPDGQVLANYRRCQPTPPALNAYLYGGRRHLVPGDEPAVVDTTLGKIGLLICSEIKVPELARIEMLRGAEILVVPIGAAPGVVKGMRVSGQGQPLTRLKFQIFKTMAHARSIENLVYTIITANVWDAESKWGACITGPEGIVAESEGPGILYGTLDMDRLAILRERSWTEEDFQETPSRVLVTDPAQHRDRRPELYGALAEAQPGAFNFFYSRAGLDEWQTFDHASNTSTARGASASCGRPTSRGRE